MYKIKEMDGYYAVFSYNGYGKFWQQISRWYYRKCYADKFLLKRLGE